MFVKLAVLFAVLALGAWTYAYLSPEWFNKAWLFLIYNSKLTASLSTVDIDMKGFNIKGMSTVEAYSVVCAMNGITFDQLSVLCNELYYVHLGSMIYMVVGTIAMIATLAASFIYMFGAQAQKERVAAKLDKRLVKKANSNPFGLARNFVVLSAVATLAALSWWAYAVLGPVKSNAKIDLGLGSGHSKMRFGHAFIVAVGGCIFALGSAVFGTIANNDDIALEQEKVRRKDDDEEQERLASGGKKQKPLNAKQQAAFAAQQKNLKNQELLAGVAMQFDISAQHRVAHMQQQRAHEAMMM